MKRYGFVLAAGLFAWSATAEAVPVGPSPYLSFADSPFNGGSFSYYHLENFEDDALNTPGASRSGGVIVSGQAGCGGAGDGQCNPIVDSVDADDGAIDGSGLAGNSLFSTPGSTGISFTFDAATLGGLPTHVGIVWTDGGTDASITFQAFDAADNVLGSTTAFGLPDDNFIGGTGEDRFFGFIDAGGIGRIFISNSTGGIEVDHLQYGLAGEPNGTPVPEPSTLLLLSAGLLSFGTLRSCRHAG